MREILRKIDEGMYALHEAHPLVFTALWYGVPTAAYMLGIWALT